MALLDRAAQRLLEGFRLKVRPRVTSTEQGGQRAETLASGLEFADHRDYTPGDDVRQIDWKAFARHKHLTIRTFQEERDVRVYVLLDVSASMSRGKPPKTEVARQLAAGFGYLGMKQLDRVQVVPFGHELQSAAPIMRSRNEYPALERFLASLDTRGLTSFAASTRTFMQRHPSRGLLFVVTDLMDPSDWSESFRLLARAGHELVVVRVTCAEDDAPVMRGEVEFDDVESGERVRVTLSRGLIEAYKREVAEHVARTRDSVRRVGGRLVETPVERPIEKLLRAVIADGEAVR